MANSTVAQGASTTTPEYVAFQQCYELVIGAVKADPGSLCDALFSKGLITESVRDYCRIDSILKEDKARKLVDSVIDRIKVSSIVFRDFIEIIRGPCNDDIVKTLEECYKAEKSRFDTDRESSSSSQPDSMNAICFVRKDSSTSANTVTATDTCPDASFVCPYCKKCSPERYLSDEGCPEATDKTLFPYLNTQGLSEEDRMVLEDTLVSATKDLRVLFAQTDTIIAQNLNADVTIVKNFALGLVGDLEQEENKAKLEKANSIAEVFLALHPYKSFLNYEIIESIVTQFGSPDDRAVMQEYVTAFNDFCKRSAFELPVSILPKKVKNTKKEKILSVKLMKKDLASLRDVVSARQKMASILGVKKWALKICSIEEGCVCVRFLVPASVMNKILPLSPAKKSALEDAEISIREELLSVEDISNRTEEQMISVSSRSSADPQSLEKSTEFKLSFLAACKRGHTKIAKLLLGKGAELSKCVWDGESPLVAAIMRGHTETAQLLIKKGADLNMCDVYGQSPLVAAIERGHTETAQLLIKKGADVNKCDWGGQSPLVAACKGGHTETAQLLIEKGAYIEKCGWGGQSPLVAACKGGHIETAQLLIEKGADVNKRDQDGQSPLIAAIWEGHTEVIQLLIEKETDVNKCGQDRFVAACMGGHTETAQLLIEKGADVNKCSWDGDLPLVTAIERGHIETAQLLIEKGADINKCNQYGQSPLVAACEGGHTDTAQLLIEKGADVDKCGQYEQSPLIAAINKGHTKTVQLLIEKGADIECYEPPLIAAIKRGHIEIAQLLIEKGADVNKCDLDGHSPLYWAQRRSLKSIKFLLIKKGAKEDFPMPYYHGLFQAELQLHQLQDGGTGQLRSISRRAVSSTGPVSPKFSIPQRVVSHQEHSNFLSELIPWSSRSGLSTPESGYGSTMSGLRYTLTESEIGSSTASLEEIGSSTTSLDEQSFPSDYKMKSEHPLIKFQQQIPPPTSPPPRTRVSPVPPDDEGMYPQIRVSLIPSDDDGIDEYIDAQS